MCDATAIYYGVAALVAVAGGVSSHEASRKANSMQEDSLQQARAAQEAAKDGIPQARQTPDENVRRAAKKAAVAGGAAGADTLLTGASGVSNDLLNLGKNTLLGQ